MAVNSRYLAYVTFRFQLETTKSLPSGSGSSFLFRSVMTGGRKFYAEGRGCSLTLPYGSGSYFRPLIRHIVKVNLQ